MNLQQLIRETRLALRTRIDFVDLEPRGILARATHDWFVLRQPQALPGLSRRLPMSSRLVSTLEMAKTDPAGRDYPATAYVFGAPGARLQTIKKASEDCVLIAHRSG